MPPNFYTSSRDAALKIGEGGFAILEEENHIVGAADKTWSERAKCDFTVIPYGPVQSGFVGIPKNSPYRKIISIGLVFLHYVACKKWLR